MNIIKTYKTYTFYAIVADNTNSFNLNINLDFIPDELSLKNFTYATATPFGSSIIIKSNLISNDGILITIPGVDTTTCVSSVLNIPFNNQGRPINGTYTFTLLNFSNQQANVFADTEISFTIQFIKYA